MNWKDYEHLVFEAIKSKYPDEAITPVPDQKLDGRFSGVKRQVDILAKTTIFGKTILAIFDCKYFSKKVDVKEIESVIGLANDVGADVGFVVTNKGYTKAAYQRVERDPTINFRLDIINIEDFQIQRPFYAVMYHGKNAAVVTAPSGWSITPNIIHDKRIISSGDALGFLHPNNFSVEDSHREKRVAWCWITFRDSEEENDLEDILDKQDNKTRKFDQVSDIQYWHEELYSEKHEFNTQWLFRRIKYPIQQYIDITCFHQLTKNEYFWAVIVCKEEEYNLSLDHLRYIARNAFFVHSSEANPRDSHSVWEHFTEIIFARKNLDQLAIKLNKLQQKKNESSKRKGFGK
jgi:hypothetical protein